MGLCLLHGIKFPLFFCRHVYKSLLGRKVNYADYAYFDPLNHDALLRLIRDAGDNTMMCWDKDVGYPDTEDAPAVTPQNVHAFVLCKAHFDMVDSISNELKWMQQGLHDVVTAQDLADLTAEDLQLLLSGRVSLAYA